MSVLGGIISLALKSEKSNRLSINFISFSSMTCSLRSRSSESESLPRVGRFGLACRLDANHLQNPISGSIQDPDHRQKNAVKPKRRRRQNQSRALCPLYRQRFRCKLPNTICRNVIIQKPTATDIVPINRSSVNPMLCIMGPPAILKWQAPQSSQDPGKLM